MKLSLYNYKLKIVYHILIENWDNEKEKREIEKSKGFEWLVLNKYFLKNDYAFDYDLAI